MARVKIFLFIFILLCSVTYATKYTTSSYSVTTNIGFGLSDSNVSKGFNISSSTGQSIIGNITKKNFSTKVGFQYLGNVTLNDTNPPTLTIYSPIATTYTTYSILINFTATDVSGVDNLWYYNGTGNTSNSSQTITLVNGNYNFTFYANDTNGNVANKTINFTVNVPTEVAEEREPATSGYWPWLIADDGTIINMCEQKDNFLDRLRDTCSIYNGICEDGETPFIQKDDCGITYDSINCENGRCIFKEIWFAKILIIVLAFMFAFYKKDYTIFIIIIVALIAVNFSTTQFSDMLRGDFTNIMHGEPTLTEEEIMIAETGDMCTMSDNFIARLRDTCSYNNLICEDGETPIHSKDCEITIGSITCQGYRCIFKEIWFAKILIILLAFSLFFYKKDYNLIIFIIIFLLLFNFATTDYAQLIKDDISNMLPDNVTGNLTNATVSSVNMSGVAQYGYTVMPSNPLVGLGIILVLGYIGLRYISIRNKRRGK